MGAVVTKLRELSTGRQGEWVDRIFARLSAMYGARFADMWAGLDLAMVKAAWSEDLGDLSAEEITRGVTACKLRTWPPTLPEFLALCRPALDPEQAFSEAVQQLARRDQGRDKWSHPAVYWSAATIGSFDLRNASWSSIKARWSRVLQAELAKGEWPAVPPRLEALPAPGATQANPERVREIIDKSRNLVAKDGDKQWAIDVENRALAGEVLPMLLRDLAAQTLGRQIERRAPACRPDHADLAAGDDSFEPAEEAVAL